MKPLSEAEPRRQPLGGTERSAKAEPRKQAEPRAAEAEPSLPEFAPSSPEADPPPRVLLAPLPGKLSPGGDATFLLSPDPFQHVLMIINVWYTNINDEGKKTNTNSGWKRVISGGDSMMPLPGRYSVC